MILKSLKYTLCIKDMEKEGGKNIEKAAVTLSSNSRFNVCSF